MRTVPAAAGIAAIPGNAASAGINQKYFIIRQPALIFDKFIG
jgi:hypothetical protein